MGHGIRIQRHFWICICLAVLNVADAFFTHQVLQKGGTELNPLMRVLYDINPVLFLFVKVIFSFLIIMIGFVPLRIRVQWLLAIAFTTYTVIIGYHLLLQIWLL
jgi:Domain of unknown function (DUF5658)